MSVTQELKAGRELDALIAEKVMGLSGKALGFPHPYSTDIATAWAILEHLERDERRILSEITRKMDSLYAGTLWVYAVELRQCTPPFPQHWYAQAPTAPEAICLAALQAVGSGATSR